MCIKITALRHALLTFLCLLLLAAPALAKEPIRVLYGYVTKVTDGESIQVDSDGAKLKVRLDLIDAPELTRYNKKTGYISKAGQPYGEEATAALRDKVLHQQVRIDVLDIDKYHRLDALVWLGDRNINLEMVKDGLAWAYRYYLREPYKTEFITAENEARQAGKGLWHQSSPVPPWDFRKQQKKGKKGWR